MSIDQRRLADNYVPSFGTPWAPILPPEQLAQLTDRQLWDYTQARKTANEFALKNPIGSGWKLPAWDTVMRHWQSHRIHVILGGQRSSKSAFAARLCVWGLGNIPEAEIRAYHVNSDRSVQDQQRAIWESLPDGIKSLPTKRGYGGHSVQYSQKNGFTGDVLILPALPGWTRGGRIDFNNYRSYENDRKTAEGFKAHLLWLDEEAPVDLFKTLRTRTTDYHGRIILTFTTIEGWTSLVQELLGKVKTLETRYAPLVKRKLPVLQESLQHDGMLIHYFWTEDNPFIDVNEFRAKMRGLSKEDVLARAYGIPTKAAKAAFPLFSRDVHVLKAHEDLPFIKNPEYPVTRYFVMDPGGSKNDFLCWVAIDAAGTWWVYREWPDMDTFGEWALPGPTPEGKAGPAQKSLGWGIAEEVDQIKLMEGNEEIFERLVDPRMGAAEKKGDEGATTLITDFDKYGMTLIPAPGVDIKSGLKLINGLLYYDTEKPIDSRNSPKIFFSPRCGNMIHMMAEYTATYSTEHTKEAPDLLRYLATANPIHVSPSDMQTQGGGGSY